MEVESEDILSDLWYGKGEEIFQLSSTDFLRRSGPVSVFMARQMRERPPLPTASPATGPGMLSAR
jgi:hypothetical protein